MTLSLVPVLIIVQLGFLIFLTGEQHGRARSRAHSATASTASCAVGWLGAVERIFCCRRRVRFGVNLGYASSRLGSAHSDCQHPDNLGPRAGHPLRRASVGRHHAGAVLHLFSSVANSLRWARCTDQYREFPAYFEIGVGIPDLLYACPLSWLPVWRTRDRIGKKGLIVWNLIGFLIIVPTASLLIQMGLPGPLQVFTTPPKALVIYEYPMALAPSVTVPFSVMFNMWVVWRLLETVRQRD